MIQESCAESKQCQHNLKTVNFIGAGEEADSPRDVMLDLSASQKSSGFEFDDEDDETQRKAASRDDEQVRACSLVKTSREV